MLQFLMGEGVNVGACRGLNKHTGHKLWRFMQYSLCLNVRVNNESTSEMKFF